ncbi:MAG: class F420-dependent enzyme [Acidimicrobiia bacterium]|nr:class F420-dependent enzyme [Acidimicrobiia bacterium]
MTTEIPASHRSILEQRTVGVLSTIGPDGRPQSTAIWFMLEGDVIRTSLLETRQKVKNLRGNGVATLFVFEPGSQHKTVEVRGDVTLEPDEDRVFTHKVIRAYGMDPATFPDDVSVGRVVLTLTPAHVVTFG